MRIDETFDADGRLREAIAYDDHAGPGTGTRTTYDADGNVTATENLTGLPIPDLPADPDLIPPNTTRLRSPR